MGFFSLKKKNTTVAEDAGKTVISELSGGSGSDISDDYIAPSAEDLEAGAATAAAAAAYTEEGADDNGEGEEVTAPYSSLEATANESPSASAAYPRSSPLELEKVPSAADANKQIDTESIEDGYVNANVTDMNENEESPVQEKDVFNGVKGTVQQPKWKDVKYAVLYVIHFGFPAYWFVKSFFPQYNQYNGGYYNSMNHAGLVAVLATTGIAGLGLAFLTFGYMLRHGETVLKTTIVFSTSMCAGVGVLGLFLGEFFMCVCGLVGFVIVSMYANMVWSRIKFTATNLTVAIAAIRDNMGLLLAVLSVAGVGFCYLIIAITSGTFAYKSHGNWTLVYSIFSYYWTHQVLTNVLSVATAGIIGRWFVIGECTPTFTDGLKEMLNRARTYSFGSICFGSLYFGMLQMLTGLSSFLASKRVPLLPTILNWMASKIANIFNDLSEWSYVYIGMYGYSYSSGANNVSTLFANKGFDGIVKYKLAGNIMFMANLAIGLLTGFCGLVFGIFEYGIMWQSGLANPTSDGFFIGFLVGFLYSSIMLSVVTSTINTLVVCLAESPMAFKVNHPELSEKMEETWKLNGGDTEKKTKSKRSLFS